MTTGEENQLFGVKKNGRKHFELIAEPVQQEILEGVFIEGWGYNGSILGPTLVVNPGDEVNIRVYNNLPESTSVHWHGLDIPEKVDGGISVQPSPPIEPGDYYDYQFTIINAPGAHLYHTHYNSMKQQMMGLAGGLIIKEENDPIDHDYFLLLQEFALKDVEHGSVEKGSFQVDPHSHAFNYFTINGRCFPDIPSLETTKGDTVRIRLASIGHSPHPMHLHGHQFEIENQGGNPLPEAMKMQRNSITLSPGETFDVLVKTNNPGNWPLHCHTPHHMANNGTEGHGGMMMSLNYK
ncbi:multicopper oxidase family protein [Salimicrobium humidisoli]|uniref:Copper oxidase n=1 Tax=Salimicrobium humidisoli TaxID=2029857 RepID=A0ABX4HQH1_9BACI|nr:multicopper oxidase domain-containing protein [Salimicrobium humidisoli]PBB04826.1 copper oxidase [Salimicrobium humidisoli]